MTLKLLSRCILTAAGLLSSVRAEVQTIYAKRAIVYLKGFMTTYLRETLDLYLFREGRSD